MNYMKIAIKKEVDDEKMNKPTFLMLVGLPASGKSTTSKGLAKEYNATIFSSDALREEMFGNVNDQGHNQELFAELHRRIKDCLRSGKSAIYDACNISYKRRMSFLAELKNISCEKICILMATPYEWCLERNAKRERQVPEDVIERMYRGFDVPWYYEGWDRIEVEYAPGAKNFHGLARDWAENVKTYNQDNSHHDLTLGKHCLQAVRYVNMYEHIHADYGIQSACPTELMYAAMLHDEGKPHCKTFRNAKGEVSEEAHYYNHERVGSYDSLFYEMDCYNLRVAVVIRWHMQPYFWEKDNNEKLHNKYRRLWGEDLWHDIVTLHNADKAAH